MAITAAELSVKFTSSGADRVKGELKGLDSAIEAAGSGFQKMYQQVNGFASKAMAGITSLADGIGKIGLAGIGAIFTKGTMAAWKQVDAVEQATLALRAYEKDATKVDKVLKDLLAFARSDEGKLFMREELFHAAQTMKVAGAETENLTRYVEIMSRSVNAGMGTWIDLERVIARVGSTGRLTGIEFELLQQMGFQLDASLRNTTITWEELFDVLDKGSVQISGQSDTIRGKMISLQTAIRGVGVAFLGVDSETSQFIDGGLGSRMVQGIDLAIAALGRLQDAARAAGNFGATILDGVEGLVAGFQMLPGPIQDVSLYIVGAIAAFGMFRQALAGITAAMRMVGLGSFTALFSPLGLAITGVAIAGGLLIKSFLDQKQAAANFETSLKSLRQTLIDLRLDNLDAAADRLESFLDMTSKINDVLEENKKNRIELEWSWDGGKTREDLQAFVDTLSFSTEEMNRFTEAQNRIGQAFADPRIDGSRLLADVTTLFTRLQYESGYTADQFLADFEAISGGLDKYGAKAEETAGKVDVLGTAMERLIESGHNATGPGGPFDTSFAPEVIEWEDFKKQVEANIEAQQKMREEWMQSALAVAGFDNALSQLNMTGHATEASTLAENIGNLGAVMERTYQIVVGGTNAIGQQMQTLDDWATNLIGIQGEWSELDELLNENRISTDQYNAAQQAQITIAAANAEVQRDLLAIQAQQAPVLAENAEQMQQYVQRLREMNDGTREGARDQLAALALMDSATQTQLQQFIELGGQLTQMGPAGAAALQQIVDGMVAIGDPSVAVLENLGLIKRELDGSYTINLDGFEDANNDIVELTRSIDALTLALGGVPPLHPEVDMSEVEAAASPGGPLGLLAAGIRGLDSLRAAPSVDVDGDGAITDVDTITTRLADIDGTTATATVNVIAGSAAVGDGTGGATNWRDFLDIPATVDTTVTATVTGAEEVQTVHDAITALPANTSATVSVDVTGWEAIGSLYDMLRDLEGGSRTVTVNVEADTSGIDTALVAYGIGGSGGPAAWTAPTLTIPVTADTSGIDAALAVYSPDGTGGVLMPGITVPVTADTSAADQALQALTSTANGVPTSVSTTAVALVDGAIFGLNSVTDAAEAIPDSVTTTVNVVDNASATLNSVANLLSAIDGRTATSYVNTVNTTTFQTVGSPVRAFASGGYVDTPYQMVGEHGPELVALPPGSYVHTAAETRGLLANRTEGIAPARSAARESGGSGGGGVVIDFSGAQFHGTSRDEMHRWAADDLMPMIRQTIHMEKLAKGVAS